MERFARLLAVMLSLAFVLSPLGAAAEGYVCASTGKRMNRTILSCKRCQDAPGVTADTQRAAKRAQLSRPCCTYVRAVSLPPVLTAQSPGLPSPDLSHSGALPAALAPLAADVVGARSSDNGRAPDEASDPSPASGIQTTLLRL